jgi:hypothetical protein
MCLLFNALQNLMQDNDIIYFYIFIFIDPERD